MSSQQGFKQNQKFMHLTNFSINKKNVNFVKNNDDGDANSQASKWSLTNLKQMLRS